MDERKTELKRRKKESRRIKRHHTALWSILGTVFLILALLATAVSAACVCFGGTIAAYYGGKLWELAENDSDAVYFVLDHETAEEQNSAIRELRHQAIAEGAVLLTNNGVLPLREDTDISALPAETGSGVCGDVLVVAISAREQSLLESHKALLTAANEQKAAGQVKAVVLLLDTPSLPRLDFLTDIDACLWTGGEALGNPAIGEILTGKINPSGSLTETGCLDETQTSGSEMYREGIYVDYKYYETRYEDFVRNTGNPGAYSYSSLVVYPFGHGLSYTTFSYSDMAADYNPEADCFTVTVTVTNTGAYAGRETVQLYAQTPYTDHDREYSVEKASVVLVAFGKTDTLAPGSAQQLTLTVERNALASYDACGAGTYMMAAGDYYLTLASDAHAAVNNILTAKGYTPETTENRMDTAGDPSLTYKYTQAEADTQSYNQSAAGAAVKNRLSYADPRLNEETKDLGVTFLSRNDWMGTSAAEEITLPQPPSTETVTGEMPIMGASNGLKLQDMMGISYDDPLWESLLDQMTYWEMVALVNVSFCESMQSDLAPVVPASLLSAAFDTELAYRVGNCMANACLLSGKHSLAGVDTGAYSADSFLTDTICAAQVKGIGDKGVVALLEGADLNGWFTEQTARERLLRRYRQTLTQGTLSGIAADTYPDILQTEWGYRGVLLSQKDTTFAGELMTAVKEKENPAAVAALRERCHRSLYSLVNSAAVNGVGKDTQVRPARLSWYQWAYIAAAALWLLYITATVLYYVGRSKWKVSPEYLNYKTMKTALRAEK